MTGNGICVGLALVMAAVIALIAFSVAQVVEGLGVMVVVLASTGWVAFCAARQRRYQQRP